MPWGGMPGDLNFCLPWAVCGPEKIVNDYLTKN